MSNNSIPPTSQSSPSTSQSPPPLPSLKGKYYRQAIQARSNYILFVNEYRFRNFRISWADVSVQIELIEQQLNTTFSPTEWDYLTDEFYNRYLYGINGKYCMQKKCQPLLYWPVYKVTSTGFWYDQQYDAQYFDIAMRSLAYHFKNDPHIRSFLKSISKRSFPTKEENSAVQ